MHDLPQLLKDSQVTKFHQLFTSFCVTTTPTNDIPCALQLDSLHFPTELQHCESLTMATNNCIYPPVLPSIIPPPIIPPFHHLSSHQSFYHLSIHHLFHHLSSHRSFRHLSIHWLLYPSPVIPSPAQPLMILPHVQPSVILPPVQSSVVSSIPQAISPAVEFTNK